MTKKVSLYIGGMTCVNCQNKIEKKLKQTKGIIRASVSYNDGTAQVVYDPEKISIPKMEAMVEELGYEVLRSAKKQTSDIGRTICILLIIIALYVWLQSMGILNLLVPSQLADAGTGYGMMFVIGLLTSVHCIAMCGGINLSQCLVQKDSFSKDGGRLTTIRPALLYNLGRVISYTAVGFFFGLLGLLLGGGAEVGIGVLFQGIIKMIVGVLMVIMGINMLGLFPGLRKFTIRMPRFLAEKAGRKKTKSNRPFYVGILNGFMPCGPLQSMWLVALASSNPLSGALSMFLFSLGTVPLMLGLGSVVSVLGRKFTDKVMTVGALLVTVLGLAMLSQGGALSGWLPADLLLVLIIALSVAGILVYLPVQKKAARNLVRFASLILVVGSVWLWENQELLTGYGEAAVNTSVEAADDVQVVYSTLEPGRYPNITVQAGIPVKWVIDAPEGSINGCNYKMVISALNLEHTFSIGENVIEFTPEETGTIQYCCWMGMIYGNIYVTDGSEEDTVSVQETSPYPLNTYVGGGMSCCN